MAMQSDSKVIVTTHSSLLEASAAPSNRGIASLPPEILSHIFILGSRTLETVIFKHYGTLDVDYGDDDDNEFATLCSHVCQYWRAIALNISQLWCFLDFTGDPSEKRCKVWIERSKDAPLAIDVSHPVDKDCGSDEEGAQTFRELSRAHAILDLILPHAHRWKTFELVTDSYDVLWLWQQELVPLRIAPILEHIGLFCHGELPLPPLHGTHVPTPSPLVLFPEGTPKIRSVNLWAVHFDWELTTFFTGLEHLHLAWHEVDVRLTIEQFVQALRLCPNLETLLLEGSAPKPGDWPRERLLLPKLRCLALTHIDVNDAISVIDHLDFPNLVTLTLDLEADTVENLILAVCQAGNKPRFGSIQSLALISFSCSITHGRLFLSTLHNVKSLRLDFNFLPHHFYDSLISHSRAPLLCPRLETLKLSGLEPKRLKTLIQARQRSPTPIRQLYVDQDDIVESNEYFQWLKDNVQLVELFENSDVEGDEDDDDEDSESWSDESDDEDYESWSDESEDDDERSEAAE